MIYRLEIENFYSFRDRQVIDLAVGRSVPEKPGRLVAIHDGSARRAPGVVIIIGANASGKSNVLRALAFIRWFVAWSFRDSHLPIPFLRFGLEESIHSTTRLSVTFSFPEDLDNLDISPTCPYVYTLEISGERHGSEVIREELHYRPSSAARTVRIFERDPQGKVMIGKMIGGKAERTNLEKMLLPNASVISTLAKVRNPFASMIVDAAETIDTNILFGPIRHDNSTIASAYMGNRDMLAFLNSNIQRFDLGIERVDAHQLNGTPSLNFVHHNLDHPLGIDFESSGTGHFVKIFPVLYSALETGGVAVVDEIDSCVHPTILPEILRWFEDPDRNPHGAQLWASCHSSSILRNLIKEEVLICEKGKDGATSVHGLNDVRGIRRDDDLMAGYLGGMFGGLPNLG